jgi:hypothetical protein
VSQFQLTALTVCTRQNDGTARCWGSGIFGNLGDGHVVNANLPVTVVE